MQSKDHIKVFFVYARRDKHYLEKLQVHLSPLKNNGTIRTWYDGDILAGAEWDKKIKENLSTADIVLLLVTANFLHSHYIQTEELNEAMARHRAGEAILDFGRIIGEFSGHPKQDILPVR